MGFGENDGSSPGDANLPDCGPEVECSNHGCRRSALTGPETVRMIGGEPAHLCSICTDSFDSQRFCHHCDQIYSCSVPPSAFWVACYVCHRFVHRQCELKSGTSAMSLSQGPGFFKCRLCRERPAFVSSGGVFRRPIRSNKPTPVADGYIAGMKETVSPPSTVDAYDDSTESDSSTEGDCTYNESRQGSESYDILDFSSLILKAAEHVSLISLRSSPTFSSDGNRERTVPLYASQSESYMTNDASQGSTISSHRDAGYSDNVLENKSKRRRSKAARTERAAAIAASYASLPNMRKTIMTINSDDRNEGDFHTTIERDWAQCDNPRCLKWRRLPDNIPLDELKGKWTCKLNRWDLEHASCDVEEEELLSGETLPEMKPGDGDYDAQKNEFYARLKVFLEEISCPMLRNPTLGGKDLDLFHLYREVTQRGGFDTVVAIEGTWARIFRTLPNYSPTVTDASYRLKRYYQEFLQSFEQRMFFRKDMRDITVQKFASRRSKKSRPSDVVGAESSPVSAYLRAPSSSENIMPLKLQPAPKPNNHGPLCVACKRNSQQLLPCETSSTGSLRICSSNTQMAGDYFLLCRQCLSAFMQPRSHANQPLLSSPHVNQSGSVYSQGSFSPLSNYPPAAIVNTVNKLKSCGVSKLYQSLPVHYPSPLP